MCTVVTERTPGEPLQILAIRDEFASRAFDFPGQWWPDHPGVVGGRDRLAGGSWCVSDIASGVTGLVLNRPERRSGTPSRGVLPLAVVRYGTSWTEHVSHQQMASFTLVLAAPSGVTAWTWDASELTRQDLADGRHVVTTGGVDADDGKAGPLAREFAARPWRDVVTAHPPRDDRTALVVRHEIDNDIYATVFGQLITTSPGSLSISYSPTPWMSGSWVDRVWPATDG